MYNFQVTKIDDKTGIEVVCTKSFVHEGQEKGVVVARHYFTEEELTEPMKQELCNFCEIEIARFINK